MGIKDVLKNISKLLLDEDSQANKALDEARVLEHGKVKIEKGKPLNSNDVQSATVNSQVVGVAAAATFVGVAKASANNPNSLFSDNHSSNSNQSNELLQSQNNEALQNLNTENNQNLASNITSRSFLETGASGYQSDISSVDNISDGPQARGTNISRDNFTSTPSKEQIPTQNIPNHNPDAPVNPTGDTTNAPPAPNTPSNDAPPPIPVSGGTTNTTPNNPVPPEVAPPTGGTTPAASVDTGSGGSTGTGATTDTGSGGSTGTGATTDTGSGGSTGTGGTTDTGSGGSTGTGGTTDTGSGGSTGTGGTTDTGSGGSTGTGGTGTTDSEGDDDHHGKGENHPHEDKMHTADDHASESLAGKDNFTTENHGEDNSSRSDETPPPLPREVSDHGQADDSSHGKENTQTVDQHASDSSSGKETLATVDHGTNQIHTADDHASDALAGKENFTTVDHGQTDVTDHGQMEEILNMSSAQGNEHSAGTVSQDWVNAVEDHPTTSFADNSGKSWTQEVETDHSDKGSAADHSSDKATAKPFESTGEEHAAEDTSSKVDQSHGHHG